MNPAATSVQPVLVVGAGTMGNGIAQVFAAAGHPVILRDAQDAALKRGVDMIAKSLDRLVKKGAIDAAGKDQILGRVHTKPGAVSVAECGLAVEAVPEISDLKKEVLRALDRELRPGAVLATNTSSISVSELGAVTGRPDRFVGMHFMNPVPVMPLVEVVRGIGTSEDTIRETCDLAKALGKTPVVVNDMPGFVSNRILLPMINEAAYALMEGVADREGIDTVMKLGMNHPMGPLALADLIGLDVCLNIMEVLYAGFSDSKYRPCPLLRQLVAAGPLGRKTGRGFYEYPSG